MSIDDQAADRGTSRWGWSRVRLPRPTGIRNGGLLLVLAALAAVVALVDEPPELGDGRRLPSIFQTLPPPTGITALPPAVAQPPPATHSVDGRPATAARAHPNRQHPRPPGASGLFRGDVERRAARDQGGSGPGGAGAGGSPPPVTTTRRRQGSGWRRSRSGSGPRRSSAATCRRCGRQRPRWTSTYPSPSRYHPTGW